MRRSSESSFKEASPRRDCPVGDAESDAKKQALFERVRNGSVRVLIGSTQKMGTGVNVQKRLVALHHLDAPWKPAEVEQREGRILRQGNENAEVGDLSLRDRTLLRRVHVAGSGDQGEIHRPGHDGRVGRSKSRGHWRTGALFAEVKAIASGNPAVLTLAEADAELQRLSILKKNHADEQYLARRNLRELPETITRTTKRVADLAEDLETLAAHADDRLIIGKRACNGDEFEVLGLRLKALPERFRETERVHLGEFQGLKFGLVLHPQGSREVFLEGATTRHAQLARESHGPRAVLNALERLSGSYESQLSVAKKELAIGEGQLRDYEARLGKSFIHDAYLNELTRLRDELKTALSDVQPESKAEARPSAAEISERIQGMRASHSIEPTPERAGKRRAQAAEAPVTTRIRERSERASVELVLSSGPAEPPPPPPAPPTETQEPRLSETSLPRLEAVRRPTMKPSFRKPLARGFQPDRQLDLF